METKTPVGKLIAFEGIDGCGKTTVAAKVRALLLADNPELLIGLDAEPSRGKAGDLLRHMLRWDSKERLRDPHYCDYFTLLMAADRIEHYWYSMWSRLHTGVSILCDRYCWSSYAYQGALGLDIQYLYSINSKVPPPDLVVYIDVPPRTALSRIVSAKGPAELFDDQEFLSKVASQYENLLKRNTGIPSIDSTESCRVDGTLELDAVVAEAYRVVKGVLP